MTVDGERLEKLWSTARARPAVKAFRTAAVGVDTAQGPVLAGVDRDGRSHLLVPLAARHTLREDVDGRAVVLRARALEDEHSYRRYASLELVDLRLADLFTALCVEVAERIAATPDRAVLALRRVLDEWRALLAGARDLLSPSALAGLFGELHMLKRMIVRDPGAVAFWTGPTGSAQDFHRGADALEVKTTISPEGRTIRVHGVDQLDIVPPGRLWLGWMRLRTDRGASVPDLVDDVLGRTEDPGRFHALLRDAGYRHLDQDIYARRRFEVVESRTYRVQAGFPRITTADLGGDAVLGGVGSIDYVVDLDAATAEQHRIADDPAHALLDGS